MPRPIAARWNEPEEFWAEAAEAIDWERRWDRVLDNTQSAVLPLVRRRAPQHLLERARPPCRGGPRRAGRADLGQPGHRRDRALHLSRDARPDGAGGRDAGRARGAAGDRVLIYMPMVPEAAIAMLACARIGAVHSVVFGGFAAHELATRIDDARPRVVLTASCGIEVNRVIPYKPLARRGDRRGARRSRKPASCCSGRCAGPNSSPGRDHDWQELEATARAGRLRAGRWRPTRSTSSIPRAPPASRKASCATMAGTPSRSPGRCANIYGVKPDEVFWTASDVGWVVGHSYIVYGPLIHGCTSVMYEGKPVGTPDAGAFWRVIERAQGARLLYRADRVPRDQARGPATAS